MRNRLSVAAFSAIAIVLGACSSSSNPRASNGSSGGDSGGDGVNDSGAVSPGDDSGAGVVDDGGAGQSSSGGGSEAGDGTASAEAGAGPSTFAQGIFRGEDPRVRLVNGVYYSVLTEGEVRKMYKSKSLIDRGVGKVVPSAGGAGYPLFAPIYIKTLNGQTYDAWFAFDVNEWECDCADPYDNIDQWHVVKSIPFTGWSIDFEIFQNSQPGSYQGNWYLVWAGADSPSTGWGFESAFIGQLLDLRAGQQTLSTFDNSNANRVAKYAYNWTDVVVEAPAPVAHNGSISVVYSGNGAETDEYALGIAILKNGADPSVGANWIDHNEGQCDGDQKTAPEFAQTTNIFGPGVARFTTSADGSEDWMLYQAKVFDTYNTVPNQTQGQQDNNEMWTRNINAERVSWRNVTCSGAMYAIPSMGTPADPGTAISYPAGDAKITPGKRRIEAEGMTPFGYVMGPTMQDKSLRVNGNPEILIAASPDASNGEKVTNLDKLAADETTTPKRSGIVWRNAPAASSLTIASASVGAAQYDLYVNGTFAQTLMLPATGGADTFKATTFAVSIPVGGEIKIVYEQGKSVVADLDYIDLAP